MSKINTIPHIITFQITTSERESTNNMHLACMEHLLPRFEGRTSFQKPLLLQPKKSFIQLLPYRLLNGRKYLLTLYEYGGNEIKEQRITWSYSSSNASNHRFRPVAPADPAQKPRMQRYGHTQTASLHISTLTLNSPNQVSYSILYIAAPTTSL